jgi:hypothetical protein
LWPPIALPQYSRSRSLLVSAEHPWRPPWRCSPAPGEGFSNVDALHIYRSFFGLLHGHVLNELQEMIDNHEETDDLLRLGLHRLPLREFPLLRSLATVLASYDGATELERGMDILLSGLKASYARPRHPPPVRKADVRGPMVDLRPWCACHQAPRGATRPSVLHWRTAWATTSRTVTAKTAWVTPLGLRDERDPTHPPLGCPWVVDQDVKCDRGEFKTLTLWFAASLLGA